MNNKIFIEKIEIKNYRLCKDTVFTPKSNLSALIGPNGSGKTTILKSIILLKLLTRERPYHPRWSREEFTEETDPTEIKVHLKVNDKKIIHRSLINIVNDNANDDEIIYSNQTWNLYSITGSQKKLKLPVFFLRQYMRHPRREYIIEDYYYSASNRRMNSINREKNMHMELLENPNVNEILLLISEFYKKMTYYSASKFTNPSLCPVSFEIDEDDYNSWRHSSGHTRWLIDLYKCWKENRNDFESFLNVIGKNGLGLIDDFKFNEVTASKVDLSVRIGGKVRKKNKENKIIVPHILMNKNILSPSQLSEGTFKTLGMIFYLMTEKNGLILLEEPEVCIHHGLLSSLVELIKICSQERQVIVSTHSDFVLDSLEPSSVHVVKKENISGITSTPLNTFLSSSDMSALRTFLSSEGNL
ncbi:MAG: AAA family ATPase, partial [Thermodesulfobacteriota bacterium]